MYNTDSFFIVVIAEKTSQCVFCQIVIEIAALLLPGIIVGVGYFTVGLTATYIFMCVLGLAFIITYPLWTRNIYKRMMKRRYENIEGFLATKV